MNDGGFIRALTRIIYSRWQTKTDEHVFPFHQSVRFKVWITFFSPNWSWSESHFMCILISYRQMSSKLSGNKTFILGIFPVFCCAQYIEITGWAEWSWMTQPASPASSVRGRHDVLSTENRISVIEMYLLWNQYTATDTRELHNTNKCVIPINF